MQSSVAMGSPHLPYMLEENGAPNRLLQPSRNVLGGLALLRDYLNLYREHLFQLVPVSPLAMTEQSINYIVHNPASGQDPFSLSVYVVLGLGALPF